MMTRETLRRIKAQARSRVSVDSQVLHSLVDHGLQALDQIDGGQTAKDRERQIGLALDDVRAALLEGNVPKATLTIELAQQLLRAKGTAWQREWAWYQPRIHEEFSC